MAVRPFLRSIYSAILLGLGRQKALASLCRSFSYRGDETALLTDGFEYRENPGATVCQEFDGLCTDGQLRSYCFVQNSLQGELLVLFDRYGSDKGSRDWLASSQKPYPWDAHTYAPFYELMFKPIRHAVKYVFECGLGSAAADYPANMGPAGRPGASLRAWRDYFPTAQILGADIDRGSLFSEDRIATAYVDQTSAESVREMWAHFGLDGRLDIMIDDGLHNFEAGSTLFENSFEYLREGGIYVIEDVAPNFLVSYDRFFTGLGLSFQLIATPRRNSMGDNIMIVIVK